MKLVPLLCRNAYNIHPNMPLMLAMKMSFLGRLKIMENPTTQKNEYKP
jgi:hypothetical protein